MTHSTFLSPISGSGFLDGASSCNPDSSAVSCLSDSFCLWCHLLPLSICSNRFGVPTRTSTERDTPREDVSGAPVAPSVNCAAIFDAVSAVRDVLFVFAFEAHRTLSLMLCKRALAKEDSCRDNSWVGAKTKALGFTARWGWDGVVDDEEASSDDLR